MAIKNQIIPAGNHCSQPYMTVTVDGEDLVRLKSLVSQVLRGRKEDPADGLLEMVRDRGAKGLGSITKVTAEWVRSNSGLYKSLGNGAGSYFLNPQVKDCKPSAGEGVCEAAQVASPDFYLNLMTLLPKLESSSSSLTYYVFNEERPGCAFFGLHRGVISFAVSRICE